jgi:hypothetical protein
MELLPKEIADRLPPSIARRSRATTRSHSVKFFTPWTSWTWYASEYDPTQRLCFGVVVGHERQLRYFSVEELEAMGNHRRSASPRRQLVRKFRLLTKPRKADRPATMIGHSGWMISSPGK